MANDFSGDSNCKALWRFESGSLTTDSKGTNTLTDNNTVGTDIVDFKEGSACADFGGSEYFSISDANLDSGYPLKNGDTNKKISICFWLKSDSFSYTGEIYSKWNSGGSDRSILLRWDNGGLIFFIGYNGGVSTETVTTYPTNMAAVKWYHIGVTFDDADKSYRIRIWDDDASALLDSDDTGNATNNINVEDAQVTIGSRDGNSTFNGRIDELVVFDRVLTTTEIDDIRQGQYGSGGALPINVTGSLPAQAGVVALKKSYHREVGGAL